MVKKITFSCGKNAENPERARCPAGQQPKTQGSLHFALLRTQLYLIKYRIKRRSTLVQPHGRSKRESRVFYVKKKSTLLLTKKCISDKKNVT